MIQAKSLSSLVTLADDPPPTIYSDQESLDPLVLYIARVPGNRGLMIEERAFMATIADRLRRCLSHYYETSPKGRDCPGYSELTVLYPP